MRDRSAVPSAAPPPAVTLSLSNVFLGFPAECCHIFLWLQAGKRKGRGVRGLSKQLSHILGCGALSYSESIMLLPLWQIPRIDILPVSAYFSINLAKHIPQVPHSPLQYLHNFCFGDPAALFLSVAGVAQDCQARSTPLLVSSSR